MTTIADFLPPSSHPTKLRLYAIACEAFPDTPSLLFHEGIRRLGYVEDVLAGLPVPTISMVQRRAIEEAAKRIVGET